MGQPLQFCRGGGCTARLGPAALSPGVGSEPHYNDLTTLVAAAWAWHKSHPHGFEEG